MDMILNTFAATIKARENGCDNRGIIAETESGKSYCLYRQGTPFGMKEIAKRYEAAFTQEIEDFTDAYEVEQKTSRKGKVYYAAKVNQY